MDGIVMGEKLASEPAKNSYGEYVPGHDYVVNGQIMVTVTLSEYRALVKQDADNKVNEMRSKLYEAQRERDALKKQTDELQKQLNELRSMIASAATGKIQAMDGENG